MPKELPEGKVRSVGHYTDGQDRIEIHFDINTAYGLPHKTGRRVEFLLSTDLRTVIAGLRSTEKSPALC